MIPYANPYRPEDLSLNFEMWGRTDGCVNIVITTGRVWVGLVTWPSGSKIFCSTLQNFQQSLFFKRRKSLNVRLCLSRGKLSDKDDPVTKCHSYQTRKLMLSFVHLI